MNDNTIKAESYNCHMSIRYKFSGVIINLKDKVSLDEPSMTPRLFNSIMGYHANHHAIRQWLANGGTDFY